jgi:hypothetical protein
MKLDLNFVGPQVNITAIEARIFDDLHLLYGSQYLQPEIQ